MAIDNLHFRCIEGNQRLKQDYEEFKIEMKNEIKKPNKSEEKKMSKKEKKQDHPNEDEVSYEVKCRIAAQKLKSIFSFMKDFKNIIDEYKKEKQIKK